MFQEQLVLGRSLIVGILILSRGGNAKLFLSVFRRRINIVCKQIKVYLVQMYSEQMC